MDPLQMAFERGVGDRFADWLSKSTNEPCSFSRRADRAPDLVYFFRGSELLVEVTAAYYDKKSHAEFLWKGAKNKVDAPPAWSGVNPDKSLAVAIANQIAKKSTKRYGSNTILLIEVPPGVTTVERLECLLINTVVLENVPFVGIYVVGTFPMSSDSAGGYRVITLKAFAQ